MLSRLTVHWQSASMLKDQSEGVHQGKTQIILVRVLFFRLKSNTFKSYLKASIKSIWHMRVITFVTFLIILYNAVRFYLLIEPRTCEARSFKFKCIFL